MGNKGLPLTPEPCQATGNIDSSTAKKAKTSKRNSQLDSKELGSSLLRKGGSGVDVNL